MADHGALVAVGDPTTPVVVGDVVSSPPRGARC
jgi:hypothetical protein